MEYYEIAFLVIAVSAGIGFTASAVEPFQNDQKADTSSPVVHEHALFHVVINGSEQDFTDKQFQLNAGDVHLENNKSEIVHKHRDGVTWERFLSTINTTYWESNSTGNFCLSIQDRQRCGEGGIYLNGEKMESLDEEIDQDDHLVIIMDTENSTRVLEEYNKMQLPQEYKPTEARGRRV